MTTLDHRGRGCAVACALRSVAISAAIAILTIGAAGCPSSSSGTDPDAGTTAPSPDAATSTPTPCSFETCSGCCRGGECVDAPDDDACGAGGNACETCSGDRACIAGQCVAPTDCSNCDGCCLDGQFCLPGDTQSACGAGGAACDVCESGEGCDGDTNTCEAKVCNATTCPNGCCTANKDCVAFDQQSLDACGKGGQACSVCLPSDESCTLGTCVADSSACLDFCGDGCCTPQGQCIPFADQAPGQCGAGAACAPCTGDLSCIAGGCTADPVWRVIVGAAEIAPTDENGEDWDTTLFTDPLPDPFVGLALADDLFIDGFTATIDNTLTPVWNEDMGGYLQSDLLSQGMAVVLRDSDGVGTFETIGQCTFFIEMSDLAAGTMTRATCGSLASNVRLDFVKD